MTIRVAKFRSTVLVLLALFNIPPNAFGQLAKIQKPKLVLTLVIDQFRADQIARFQSRFTAPHPSKDSVGGFQYLLEKGAYFPFAEYGILQNMTCPGHATILSGAYPYRHGIAINDWIDSDTGKPVYCVEDPLSPLVGESLGNDRMGISPKNFHGSTFGDELKNSGYRSKSVTIALKDRAAVLLGGYRNDLALWYDTETKLWISSRFYLPDGKLPAWVAKLNADVKAQRAASPVLDWNLPKGSGSGTSLSDNASAPSQKGITAVKSEFPHQVTVDSAYAAMLPFGTKITVDAAVAAIDAMRLGQSPDPDLLAVSFSNHDFMSHTFGPNSRELEELTVVEDQEIARLLTTVDKKIGLQNVIIVLTADHGASPNPDWLKANRVDAGRVDEKAIQKLSEDFLIKAYGKPEKGNWIIELSEFNFYLNRQNLTSAKISLEDAERKLEGFLQNNLKSIPGIADVFSGSDVRANTLPPGLTGQQIMQTYQAGRSGDVVMIPKPYFIVPGATTTHLSGYAYDRMVPLFLVGPQIKAGIYGQKAGIIDIAPTLSFFTGTTPPSGSEGRVLYEIFRDESVPERKH